MASGVSANNNDGDNCDAAGGALLSAQGVASLPPPGLSGPGSPAFSPHLSRYLTYVSSVPSSSGSSGSAGATRGGAKATTATATKIRIPKVPTSSYKPLTAAAALNGGDDGGATTTTTTSSRPASGAGATATADGASATTTASTESTGSNGASSTGSSSSASSNERILLVIDLAQPKPTPRPLLRLQQQDTGRSDNAKRRQQQQQSQSQPQQRSKRRMIESDSESLQERLRRERQRIHGGLTQFGWAWTSIETLRVLVPARGSLYVQDHVDSEPARLVHDKSLPGNGAAVDPQLSPDGRFIAWTQSDGELYVKAATARASDSAIRVTYGAMHTAERQVSHGIADFVAQEEMDRYRGYWWHPDSTGILLTRVDESQVPLVRILHHTNNEITNVAGAEPYEDHRYPFAGKSNPVVTLGYVRIDAASFLHAATTSDCDAQYQPQFMDPLSVGGQHQQQQQQAQAQEQQQAPIFSPAAATAHNLAMAYWKAAAWLEPPIEGNEYLARVYWLQDGQAVAQWQNRAQNLSVLQLLDLETGTGSTLLLERSDFWINLHHMFYALPNPIHPDECMSANSIDLPNPLPAGSFSFIFASEQSGYSHLYLYTYCPGINSGQAVYIRTITQGEWMVEHICGVNLDYDIIYFTGTFDSVLERHLYCLPLLNRGAMIRADQQQGDPDAANNGNGNGSMRRGLSKMLHTALGGGGTSGGGNKKDQGFMRPQRLTADSGTHSIAMDEHCRYFVDTSSDLNRPTSVKIFELPLSLDAGYLEAGKLPEPKFVLKLFDATVDDKSLAGRAPLPSQQQKSLNNINSSLSNCFSSLPPPEILSFPTSDGADTLYAALYSPDPRIHGPGPYPLISAVYGGPHVQRVNRSWSQCADMRAQRLRSLGFCVVKCDNRGSSRRGMEFESAIARRLGRVEVLDQVACVRQLVVRGIADPTRVGVYGWSYGGYLASMCLCRAPDVFHAAVAGAPVTSWDGYDTHYTERYMGLPSENAAGYRESAVFEHVPNMRGRLMLVHGLIDENVHFRHTARLINKLTACGKEYDLLIFPDERHSPRRLRDRVYMEQRISDFFLKNLSGTGSALDLIDSLGRTGGLQGFRTMAGHL